MEPASLSSLIDSLEKGTNMHIAVAFLGRWGNQKTRCRYDQNTHSSPVCLEIKRKPDGLSSCYRCRMVVQKAVIRRRKPMAGVCTNGVYEYCRPVVYDDQVCCVIFVSNILTQDPLQRKKLESKVDSLLLQTMEQSFSPKDCSDVADIVESYIVFLFDHYGTENKNYDPLVGNIKNYVRENLFYGMSMEELAAAFNYTEKYLGRMFKARTGHTIKEYCNKVKVNQAKKLLETTELSVEEVGLQSGFNSITYFDRVFHKFTGLPPQMYRNSVNKRGSQRG